MPHAFYAFTIHDPAIDQLRYKIRYGSEPDNPQLLHLWFDMETATLENEDVGERWQLCIAEFRLLLDAFADDIIPTHWRRLCLDHIHRPLSELNRLATNTHQQLELKRLLQELRITSHFFDPA